MTKEELIASYPSSSIIIFLFCIAVSVFFLIAAISAAMADHKVMSSIFGVIFILLALGGLVGIDMGREPTRELVSEWKLQLIKSI